MSDQLATVHQFRRPVAGSTAGHEDWVTLDELAAHYGMKKRWVEYRIAEGMPSRLVGGKRRVRISTADDWLRRHGHIEEEGR